MMIQKVRIAVLAIFCGLAGSGGALAQTQDVSVTVAPYLNYGQTGLNSLSLLGLSGSPLSFSVGGVTGEITFTGSSSLNGVASGTPFLRGSGGAATIDFSTTQKFFAMRWGSVDTSNVLSFYNNNQLVYSMTGAQANEAAGGPTSGFGFNAAFNFGELGYDRVVGFDNVTGFEMRDIKFSESNVDVAPIPLNAASLGGLMSFLMMLAMRGKGGTQVAIRMAFASIMPRRRRAYLNVC